MDPRIQTVTKEWRFRSCDRGFAGLHALADAEFSGAVSADGAQGFMVNGRLVGIAGGSIESFWGNDISALESSDPALPLLCAMLTADASVEGDYYTGETAISDVDETLRSGSFTGYIELSENVFSGDYFVLYYGGTARPVALLGTEDRVVTGDEAFQRASDEVGIYHVKSVDISVIDIPDPEVDDSATPEDEDIQEPQARPPEPTAPTQGSSTAENLSEPAEPTEPATESTAESGTETPVAASPPSTESNELAELAMESMGGSIPRTQSSSNAAQTNEILTIPSLDPNRSSVSQSSPDPGPSHSQVSKQPSKEEPSAAPKQSTSSEVEELKEELSAAQTENERLEERVMELEAELAQLQSNNRSTISANEAIQGTNLFVRYESRAQHTLEDAQSGTGDRDTVATNLTLEWHTEFDAENSTIDGEPFPTYLQSTIQFKFVRWILDELFFDLRDTGQEQSFQALYEAIPSIDRIEFGGDVPVHTKSAGERRSETYTFDVVFRDGMGEPLLVADVHTSRSPAGGESVGQLLTDVNTIATERTQLSGALFVTQSYFEPDALETVADATGGGFLRGGSKESYVSVSRKHGFHLCLVEARNDSFHLNIPDN